jgi:hypothetical protein
MEEKERRYSFNIIIIVIFTFMIAFAVLSTHIFSYSRVRLTLGRQPVQKKMPDLYHNMMKDMLYRPHLDKGRKINDDDLNTTLVVL